MPNLTVSNTDGYIAVSPTQSSTSLADARNATTATGINTNLNFLYCVHSGFFSRYYIFKSISFNFFSCYN